MAAYHRRWIPHPPSAASSPSAAWPARARWASAASPSRRCCRSCRPTASTLSQGAWLAGANYLGYLAGALACVAWPPTPARAARGGCRGRAAHAGHGAAPRSPPGRAARPRRRGERLRAGRPVGVGAAALAARRAAGGRARLRGRRHRHRGGGGVALRRAFRQRRRLGWLSSAACAARVAAWWPGVARRADAAPAAQVPGAGAALPRRLDGRLLRRLRLRLHPARHVPARDGARSSSPDPAVFGWTWPVFGLAAALSTSRRRRAAPVSPRRSGPRANS